MLLCVMSAISKHAVVVLWVRLLMKKTYARAVAFNAHPAIRPFAVQSKNSGGNLSVAKADQRSRIQLRVLLAKDKD